jgi:hypothetical protein
VKGKNMRKTATFIFILIIALLLVPRLTSAAYGQANDYEGNRTVLITAADPTTAPAAVFYSKAIGSVAPGDLYYADATASTTDITLNLYITNTDELVHYLRYLTLRVAIYVEDNNGQRAAPQTGNGEITETYLTLQNSPAAFTLPGGARYRVAVVSGCFYCLSAGSSGYNITPLFYLETGH